MALDWSRELLVRSWEGNKGRLRQQILFHLNYTNQRNIERMLKKKKCKKTTFIVHMNNKEDEFTPNFLNLFTSYLTPVIDQCIFP